MIYFIHTFIHTYIIHIHIHIYIHISYIHSFIHSFITFITYFIHSDFINSKFSTQSITKEKPANAYVFFPALFSYKIHFSIIFPVSHFSPCLITLSSFPYQFHETNINKSKVEKLFFVLLRMLPFLAQTRASILFTTITGLSRLST